VFLFGNILIYLLKNHTLLLDIPLLIEGETGVVKKEIAAYLHLLSPRKKMYSCKIYNE
jgi:DNA-binding NtrC family response regulator